MKFALVITGAPNQSQAAQSALAFARASLTAGHDIHRVFFYFDGVLIGSSFVIPPQDEIDVGAEWVALAAAHGIELAVCIAASLRRGLVNDEEAARYDKPAANLRCGFEIVGLGQLVEAMIEADRCITFGP